MWMCRDEDVWRCGCGDVDVELWRSVDVEMLGYEDVEIWRYRRGKLMPLSS